LQDPAQIRRGCCREVGRTLIPRICNGPEGVHQHSRMVRLSPERVRCEKGGVCFEEDAIPGNRGCCSPQLVSVPEGDVSRETDVHAKVEKGRDPLSGTAVAVHDSGNREPRRGESRKDIIISVTIVHDDGESGIPSDTQLTSKQFDLTLPGGIHTVPVEAGLAHGVVPPRSISLSTRTNASSQSSRPLATG
jgi:hypothetical protein